MRRYAKSLSKRLKITTAFVFYMIHALLITYKACLASSITQMSQLCVYNQDKGARTRAWACDGGVYGAGAPITRPRSRICVVI